MTAATDYINAETCRSLHDLFLTRLARTPDTIAYRMCNKITGEWQNISWHQMGVEVRRWRQAMLADGLQKGDRVAILLPNCPEWVACEQAAMSLGLLVVPLYANDRAENVAYILEHTQSRLLVCPGKAYLDQLAPLLPRLPDLKRIVTIDFCQFKDRAEQVACITEWLPVRRAIADSYEPESSDVATIVYTSGTTGPPKGVILSHRNILSNAYAGLRCMDIYRHDLFLSFLPMSHMLERTAGYYMPMMAGATVAFARSIPQLGEDLITVRPTVMVAVPRIFEKVYNSMMAKVEAGSPLAAKLFHRAVEGGWLRFLHKQKRGSASLSLLLNPLYDLLVGRKVRQKLGGNLRIIISGGAPLAPDIAKVFIGLGLPIYQGYGLTETSPVVSVNRQHDNRPEGVGQPLPGVEVRVEENGELLVRGDCVMQGYWRNDQATKETIDPDGWLHSGDKAVIEESHIRITGRIKEIIVLSNGEKIAPADIEMAISLDPLFENTMVIGEGRPYLTLLAVLNQSMWEELAGQLGVDADHSSLMLEPVRQEVLSRLERLLAGFPGYVFIRDVSLSLQPWTVESGLLTPTMKLKRTTIRQAMEAEIDRMYSH